MSIFNLPDLGEGLPDAEIVEWLVDEGDRVELDQPLVSMETAKAVVEVPSPYEGRVVKFHGRAGDVIQTGAPLAEFQVEGEETSEDSAARDGSAEPEDETAPSASDAAETIPMEAPTHGQDGIDAERSDGNQADNERDEPDADDGVETAGTSTDADSRSARSDHSGDDEAEDAREDSGTVVGNVQSSNEVLSEKTSLVGGVKVTPAVRALARKLRVDLASVRPTGANDVVTAADVRKAAENPPPATTSSPSPAARAQTPAVDSGRSASPSLPQADSSDDWEPVRGTRRTMARVMSESHRSVVPTTLMDDADIHAWQPGEDITVRLLRALWAGAQAEPGLNAWFDGENSLRMVHKNMHVGMAVDTADGLFVAALRNVNRSDRAELRADINRLRENASNRTIPPEDLKDYTIILSNFGKFAGRYATPVITPPCVAIVAAGKLRHEVVPVLGGVEVHRMVPLSLTFDHRACTGGEAARFLRAMLDDLAKAH